MHVHNTLISFLFLSLFPYYCSAQGSKIQKFLDSECVDRIRNKYPDYVSRFKEDFIHRSCEKSRVWKDDAINGKGRAARDPILSPKQLEYFNSVTTCKGLQCLCEQWQLCKNIVSQIQQGITDLGDLGQKIKNGNIGDVLKNLNASNSAGTGASTTGTGTNTNGATDNTGNGHGNGHGNGNAFGHEKGKGNPHRSENGNDDDNDNGTSNGHSRGRGNCQGRGKGKCKRKRQIDLEALDAIINFGHRSPRETRPATEEDKTQFLDQMIKSENRRKRQADVQNILQKFGKVTRKEIRAMTDDERRRLFVALNTLKSEKLEGWTKYDILIVYHTPEYAPGAHFGAAFLPFHRELLKNIEIALRQVDPQVSMPYWDSTLDSGLPNPADSILWTDDFFGPGTGEVTTGPFGNWTTIPDKQIADLSPKKKIVRGLAQSPIGSLFKQSDVDTILAKPDFRSLVFCTDPFFELVHGAKHLWVGGHMVELRISPNDPVFFMIHTWVDHLWELWRNKHQNLQQRETDYVAANLNETCNEFSMPDALLKPYNVKVKEGLSNKYLDNFYSYQERPTCPSCQNSQYLFCDTSKNRCLSKIKQKGNCTGFDGRDICYKGVCTGGVCVPTAQQEQTLPPVTVTLPPVVTIPTTTTSTTSTTTTTTTTTITTTTPTLAPQPQVTTTTLAPTVPTAIPTVEIVPQTAPPKTGTQPPVVSTIWIPITVLLERQGNASVAYTKAKILTRASSSDQNYEGIVANPNDQPYYTGAAYAQMPNPFAGVSPVRATIAVYDEFNQPCTSLCLVDEKLPKYEPCQATVVKDVDPEKSDKVASTPTLALGKLLNWKGYKRSPDNFVFTCNTQTAQAPQPAAPPTPVPGVTSGVEVHNIAIGGGKFINIVTTNDAAHQIANGGCHNWDRCCIFWADVGECKRNPWMQNYCQWACHVCNPGENIAATECCDYHPKCPQWASSGECQKRPIWMEENCKESCKVCGRSKDDLGVLCGVPKKQGCKNYNEGCDRWSKKGECDRNPWWMKENCPLACKHCTA